MKLTAKVKLQPTPEQAAALRNTMECANRCADWMSALAWESGAFQKFSLQKIAYHEAKAKFGLTAQILVRLIGKVADSYQIDKKVQRTFRPHGAIPYDDRILRWYVDDAIVSIWSTAGRLKIPFVGGPKQLALLQHRQGESDLIFHRGKFYLAAVCNSDDPTIQEVDDFLGVDLGVVHIAADSDGESVAGNGVNNVRFRHRKLRGKLQAEQTRSAKRKLKRLSGSERRFATDTNHCISKQIVAKAKRTGRGIALEELSGIRDRIRARRKQRAVLHSWSFSQLQLFVAYKARLAGVPVVFVDPRNTSRTCTECGHVAKANRASQSDFRCVSCGYEANADLNAAENIRRAAINRPIVASCAA